MQTNALGVVGYSGLSPMGEVWTSNSMVGPQGGVEVTALGKGKSWDPATDTGKDLNSPSHQGHANQSHSELSLTPIRMVSIRKTRSNKCWRGCGENGAFVHCGWEGGNSTTGYSAKENENTNPKRYLHLYIYCGISYNSPDTEASRLSVHR